jgi:hypothetical protein
MNRPHSTVSLGGALLIIEGSCFLGMVLMILAGIILDDFWYYVAAAVFAIAGIVGFVAVRKLEAKINGPRP